MNSNYKLSFIEKIVLAILEDSPKGALNTQRVFNRIPLDAKIDKESVYQALLSLTQKKLINQPSKGQFAFVKPSQTLQGRLITSNKGEYYVVLDDGLSYFIPTVYIKQLLPEDRVECEYKVKGKRVDIVYVRLIDRKPTKVVGYLDVFEKNAYLLTSKAGFKDIKIKGEVDPKLDGQKAIVEVYDFPPNTKYPLGRILEVFGTPGNNETEMHAIVGEFGFKTIFPKDVLEETEAIDEAISNNEIKSRKDFRDVTTFTIDPADAKDFDDAISYRELENGHVKIGVHIADVSHYVKVGSPLDREAFERGTSVYLVDRTIPMLPEKLSNNLCSLRPNENRLAFSVEFELNAQFQIVNKWIGKTIIHSNRRFSYEEAQEIIVAETGEYAHELVTLNNISKIYEKDRFEDGALKFESKELRFKLTESGEPIEVYEKTRFDAHKMIETYMLLANKAIAEHVYKLRIPNLPFIYRTHDNPPQEKLIEFAKFCKIMGYPIQIDNEKVMRKSFNSLLERAENKPELSVLQQMAIRTMAKAVYTAYKTSHFGLAFEYYTHFTSPIRRYPDLLAHRMLFNYLNDTPSQYNEETIESFAKHSSLMEQKAAEAERASVKYKMAELMKKHEGEIFEARISGITEWGIYATILDLHAEGLIKVSEIKFDRFYYVEDERKLMGKRTKRSFHMGDIITIKVKSANPIARQIDFYLYE